MPGDIRVPVLGESVVEATVGRWLKQVGETVSVGEPLVELETDKVNVEVPADVSGVLASAVRSPGETVRPGDVLGTVTASAASNGAAQPVAAEPVAPETVPSEVRVSPLAARVAEDLGVDVTRVPATGPGQRVTREDVQAFARAAASDAPTPPVPAGSPPPAAATTAAVQSSGRPETRQRLSRRRLTIARRLVEAQHTAAMLTTFNEVDMSEVVALRKRRREEFQKRTNANLGFMSFFTRATIGALRAFPAVNSELQGEELVVKQHYDIGIAIGDSEGLVVPVLRDADRMSFAQIEQAIAAFAEKARNKALTVDDLRGGTFTITNGGVYGSLLSTPILNPPQVGILGMHRMQDRPVAVNGEVQIRPMMYLALTYDHRVVDGREAVQFLVRIKEMIEDPERLLLEA